MAREFVRLTIGDKADEAFESELSCRTILGALERPEHFFWFEYNFLLPLRKQLAKEILGDRRRISSTQPVLLNQRRGPPPYAQRSRSIFCSWRRQPELLPPRLATGRGASVFFKLRGVHRQYFRELSLSTFVCFPGESVNSFLDIQ